MLAARLMVCLLGLALLAVTGCGGKQMVGKTVGAATATATLSRRPSPADFVANPSCMLYANRADTRVRVRAASGTRVCRDGDEKDEERAHSAARKARAAGVDDAGPT